jgi:hypothetical protein
MLHLALPLTVIFMIPYWSIAYDSGRAVSGMKCFALLNTGIVGSNRTKAINVYVYSGFVLSCV